MRDFLRAEAAGGIVLLAAAAVALVWANSPWDDGYRRLWETELRVELGRWVLEEDLRHWVNDALMALFFFVVGLEIKRELVAGELRDRRAAALPAVAALGGMVVPALLFFAITIGTDGSDGWGIPMATDIAFAVGVVALFGARVSSGLKLFLLTLAIVDDIGAIVVIAAFYSEGLELEALLVALALIGVIVAMRVADVRNPVLFAVVGMGVWAATYQSGVHATIAGVALGLLTPARPMASTVLAKEWARELSDEPTADELRAVSDAAGSGISVAERLQHALHPLTSFGVIPIFALANAGVALEVGALDESATARLAAAIVVGLVVGKLLGILGATWLAVRWGLGHLPGDASWAQTAGIAGVAGIGFTVSLFIAGLAFEAPELETAAKIGVLGASVVAAAVGSLLLLAAGGESAESVHD
jgi:NhaA family Na+:H+ antiporter